MYKFLYIYYIEYREFYIITLWLYNYLFILFVFIGINFLNCISFMSMWNMCSTLFSFSYRFTRPFTTFILVSHFVRSSPRILISLRSIRIIFSWPRHDNILTSLSVVRILSWLNHYVLSHDNIRFGRIWILSYPFNSYPTFSCLPSPTKML